MELVTQAMELTAGQESPGGEIVREKEDIFVGGVVSRYDRYKSILANDIYRPQWIRNYKLWRSYLDKSKYPHRSKLFIPLTFQYIETILPRVASNKITIGVTGRRPKDMQFVPALNDVMKWSCKRARLNQKWPTFAKQLILQGYSLTYSFWNVDLLSGFPFPDFRVIDLFNLYVDPVSFQTIEEAPEAIIRVPTYIGALEKKAKFGIYDPGIIDRIKETGAPFEDNTYSVTERHSAVGAGHEEEECGKQWRKVELMLHITPEKTTVIANRKVVIRTIDNFGISPLAGCTWTEDMFHMFGLGQVEPGQGLQHAINAANNMLFDQRTLSLRPATLVGTANATVEDSKFQARSGAVIRVTDVNQVRPYVQPDVSMGVNEERMFYIGQMQETHSTMDIVRGASGADETATQAQINNAAIETKLAFPTRHMEAALERMGTVWQVLLQKNMTPETLMALGYEDGEFPLGMPVEALEAKVNFTPVIEPEAPLTKQFKRRTMQEAIGGLLNLPGFPELMMSNPMLAERIYSIALKHFDLDEGQELIGAIRQSIEMVMQPPPPQQGPPQNGPAPNAPPQQGPPPPPPAPPQPQPLEGIDTASIFEQLSDAEIEQLLSMPPEQMAQVMLSLTEQQAQARPQNVPTMMPAVRAQGVM